MSSWVLVVVGEGGLPLWRKGGASWHQSKSCPSLVCSWHSRIGLSKCKWQWSKVRHNVHINGDVIVCLWWAVAAWFTEKTKERPGFWLTGCQCSLCPLERLACFQLFLDFQSEWVKHVWKYLPIETYKRASKTGNDFHFFGKDTWSCPVDFLTILVFISSHLLSVPRGLISL